MARKADAPDPIASVRLLLERLNLTTPARRLAELLAQAEAAQPSYSAFLHTLLEAEKGTRWERKLQRRRRWSRLGPPVTLDGFDWAARPQLSPQVVKELLTCRFIDEHRNVILVGRPSTGKTTVAKALGHAACARALSVSYAPMADVLQALHAARADGTYRKVFRRVTEAALLILDCRFRRPHPRRRQRAVSRRVPPDPSPLHRGLSYVEYERSELFPHNLDSVDCD